jgi:hypothetical protein
MEKFIIVAFAINVLLKRLERLVNALKANKQFGKRRK